jgi:GAF domain-containing protein
MDIKIVIRKSLIYSISLLLTFAAFAYVALLIKNAIEKSWNASPNWTTITIIALVAIGFPALKMLVEKSINTIFKGKKSFDLAVKELREQISQETQLIKLSKIIGKSIKQYIKVSDIDFYFISHKNKQYEAVQEDKITTLELGSDLIRYFDKYAEVLVREEIPHLIEDRQGKFEHEQLVGADKVLRKLGSSLAMPFFTEDEIFAIALFGKREAPYTVQDIEYIEQLREQTGATMANALLYQEAMERIQTQVI